MPARTAQRTAPAREQINAYEDFMNRVRACTSKRQVDATVYWFMGHYPEHVRRGVERAACDELDIADWRLKHIYATGVLSAMMSKELRRRYP